ncbi:MAG: hypothetical protein KatS3mg115_2219 [Candidatus Poribacteria bacterium]|nr:MAG: hypothetical protein KatS3mg115_2219 [Candidatus Poribacteria bacterium]
MRKEPSFQPPVIRPRAWIAAVLCSILIAFWTQHSELVIDSPSFNSIHPSVAGFFAVIVLTLLVNPILRGIRPSWGLSQRETLLVYSVMIVVGPIVSIGGVHFLLPTLIAPFYYATPENEYQELFHSYIPSWFGPKDPTTIRQFYEGSEGMGVPWELWWQALILWSLFLLAVYGLFLSLNVILRRQWVDREKLTFPLVQLPLEMTQEPPPNGAISAFFKNGWMWLGFAIPLVLHGINGTHTYIPTFPQIRYKHISLRPYFSEPPWDQIGQFEIGLYPSVIGFSYILTLEISFSVAFFYLFSKFQQVFGAAMGWVGRSGGTLSQFPFVEEQGGGAFLAIAIASLIMASRHLREIGRSLLRPELWREESWAVVGLIGSLAFLVGWSLAAGVAFWVAIVFFVIFGLFAIALTRMRVQAGLGAVHGPLTVQDLLVLSVGSSRLGPRNLTILAHYFFMTGEMRGVMSVMPSQLEGFRLAEYVGIPRRKVIAAVLIGSVVGLALAHVAALRTIYHYGGNVLNNWRVRDMPHRPFQDLRLWLTFPRDPDWMGMSFVGVGALITLTLTYLRLKFLWWPFHPIGYAAAYTGRTIHWVWFPILLGCVFKFIALRHGGPRTYRQMLPFFLGLILGDFFMGGFWGVIGLSSSQPGYLFFP